MELTWNILNLEHNIVDGTVIRVHYLVNGTNNNITISKSGTITLEAPSDVFIPLEDLTENIVVGWLEQHLGETEIQRITDIISKEIELSLVPKTVTVVPPWVN